MSSHSAPELPPQTQRRRIGWLLLVPPLLLLCCAAQFALGIFNWQCYQSNPVFLQDTIASFTGQLLPLVLLLVALGTLFLISRPVARPALAAGESQFADHQTNDSFWRGPLQLVIGLVVVLLFLYTVLHLCSDIALINVRPCQLDAVVNPLATADYGPWGFVVFKPVDPRLGTQVALDQQVAVVPSGEALTVSSATEITTTPTPSPEPTTAVPATAISILPTLPPPTPIATTVAPTWTRVPADTPTRSVTETATATASRTPTLTFTPSATSTPTATPVVLPPVPPPTALPTWTPSPTPLPANTRTPTPTPTPSCPGTGSGLKGEYYNRSNFAFLATTRTDATINFDWSSGSPDPSIYSTDYSVRWTGQVMACYTETYTFFVAADDGVRLWVNGVQLINYWNNQVVTERSGTISLVAGQSYNLRLDFYNGPNTGQVYMSWQSASQPKGIIPQSQLFPTSTLNACNGSGTGLLGAYYDNMNFTSFVTNRVDPSLQFDWNGGVSPAPGVSPDTYSVRWTGKIQACYTETYTFTTYADDGTRLWVNGVQLVNNWVAQSPTEFSGSINLMAGQQYDIILEYYQDHQGALISLQWSSNSQPKGPIPASQLYPVALIPLPTVTPSPTLTPSSTYTPTNTPTATYTPTATSTPTNTPTSTPTATPTDTPTSTPTDTPTNTPTATPTDTPTPDPNADLYLTFMIPSNTTPAPGEIITMEVRIRNFGPANSTGVQVRDILPSGLNYISSSAILTSGFASTYDNLTGIWSIPNFGPAGTLGILDIQVQVDPGAAPGAVITNTADIIAAGQPNPPAGDTISASVTVQ